MEGFGAIDAPDERRERLATLGGLFHGPSSGLVYVLTLALMPREDRSDFHADLSAFRRWDVNV
jgi:hypothetical protein